MLTRCIKYHCITAGQFIIFTMVATITVITSCLQLLVCVCVCVCCSGPVSACLVPVRPPLQQLFHLHPVSPQTQNNTTVSASSDRKLELISLKLISSLTGQYGTLTPDPQGPQTNIIQLNIIQLTQSCQQVYHRRMKSAISGSLCSRLRFWSGRGMLSKSVFLLLLCFKVVFYQIIFLLIQVMIKQKSSARSNCSITIVPCEAETIIYLYYQYI